ncbi:hypothetical protein ACIOHS_03720 [Streptomyces sp. NPDC088253]|uniref:hypothetical protein n=1 Tax=Streptomyces sp. NPDC088253 TaxID=3365846 RepID=UPI0038235132
MSLEQHRASGPVDDMGDEVPEPSGEERAAWARVRRSATGMGHHEARSALATARKAAHSGSLTGQGAVVARAEVEEWERVTGTLADHAGPYDPADDPFVQGEQDARAQTLPHQR